MKQTLQRAYRLLVLFGIDPVKTILSIKGLSYFFHDFKLLRTQMSSMKIDFPLGKVYPCLVDRFSASGVATGHYFHQDLLVARRIYLNKPHIHIDVGSRVDGFVAHVAAFRLIKVLDIRPLLLNIQNITFLQVDFMKPIQDDFVGCCDSLSCLHAIEHFGLGRYGDTVDYEGYYLGLNNLHRILKTGGKLYFSVPIGPQRIEFNAHRVFSVSFLLAHFSERYRIDQFSYVDDQGDLHENIPITESDTQRNYGCVYGCGIFEMTKL